MNTSQLHTNQNNMTEQVYIISFVSTVPIQH